MNFPELTLLGDREERSQQAAEYSHRITPTCLLIVIASTLMSACGDNTSQLVPLSKDAIIVAFGDSLTEGTGARNFESYPAVLAELSDRRVVNAGVAGEISKNGLSRLTAVLNEYKPNLVILCHGGNDLLRKFNTQRLKENLQAMIAQIKASGAQVMLLGVPKPSLLLGPASVYQELAAEHSLVADLEVISTVLSKPRLKSDPVHPNAEGYKTIAEVIHQRLSEAGAY